jgi:putative ABC transport system ATP-binding protein
MIRCDGLVKIYKTAEIEVVALQGLNLTIEAGEMMAIIGNSGSGKSTLLNILGGLDRPSAGLVRVGPWDLLKITDAQLVQYKRETVGFIWQNNARNLLPYLTTIENVETVMMLNGKLDRIYAKELLERVGLAHRMHSKLQQLSGGEQQRVAIAISLANRPALLLADEPTGSVDSETAERILDIFRALNKELSVTIVIVTHDLSLAHKVNRVVAIRDGQTSSEMIRREVNESNSLKSENEPQVSEDRHEEYIVLDRAGRLQVPKAYLDALQISGKASMDFDGEKIMIRAPK